MGFGLGLSVVFSALRQTTAVVAPALDRVVNFVATGSGAMYQNSAIFNNAGAFPLGGWMMGFAYYDGTNWAGNLMGLGDPTIDTRYMELTGNRFVVRDGESMVTTAAATPAVGWHLVTGYFVRHATDTTHIISNHFLRDGAAVVSQNASGITGGVPASFSRLGLGYRPRLTASQYATFKASGFAVGTGNPTALHAWVYNGGAFGREITDYPGDAGVAITHYWPGARVGAATLSGSEAALQDTVGSLDAWTLIGAPVWATPAPPF